MKEVKSYIKARLLKSIWSSLNSHISGMYEKSPEGKPFHRLCVKKYIKDMDDVMKL